MNFILTGHKGLIGSFLLERLKEKGDEPVLLIDKRDGKNVFNIDSYEIPEGKKVDIMIHLAAFCKINKSIENPKTVFEDNVIGIYKVLEFCRKNKIPKIIFTSSTRILSPEKNPYTASKIYGEELVKGYCQCYGIDYVIVRPSTVYGPFNDYSKRLIDIFILNALQEKELKIFGNKEKTLGFTYVDDFIDGFLIAMQQKDETFDLSCGEEVKVEEVADLIISLAGKGSKGFYEPEIAQPQKINLDISKLKNLGYSPKVDIKEGVKRTFEWYKENLDEILKSREQKPPVSLSSLTKKQ